MEAYGFYLTIIVVAGLAWDVGRKWASKQKEEEQRLTHELINARCDHLRTTCQVLTDRINECSEDLEAQVIKWTNIHNDHAEDLASRISRHQDRLQVIEDNMESGPKAHQDLSGITDHLKETDLVIENLAKEWREVLSDLQKQQQNLESQVLNKAAGIVATQQSGRGFHR